MPRQSFADFMITVHDNKNDYEISSDCDLLAYKHFQQISSQRIERNEEIYNHVAKLSTCDKFSKPCDKFIEENPFPDNDCKLAMIKAVTIDGLLLKHVSETLRNDEHIILKALKKNINAIEYLSEEWRGNREFIEKVFEIANDRYSRNRFSFFKFLDKFHDDEEIVKKVVKKYNNSLEFVSDRLKNNREVVLLACKRRGSSIQFVPAHLIDRELILICSKTNSTTLKYVSPEMLNDKDIILSAVSYIGMSFKYASEELKNDRDFVLEMVKRKGECYCHIPPHLRGDREIAMLALPKFPHGLEYAPENIRDDEEIITLTTRKVLSSISYASNRFRDNHDFIYDCASSAAQVIGYLDYCAVWTDTEFIIRLLGKFSKYNGFMRTSLASKISNTNEIALKLIEIDPNCFKLFTSEEIRHNRKLIMDLLPHDLYYDISELIPDCLRNDRELILRAVKICDDALQIASEELCADRELANQALMCNFSNFEFLSNELRSDRQIVEEAITKDGYMLKYVPESLRNDRELVLKAIRLSPQSDISPFIGYELKEDRELILESVKLSGCIENILQDFKNDREIVQIAIQENGDQLQYASTLLRSDRELALIAVRNLCSLQHVLIEKLDRQLVYEALKHSPSNLEYALEYADDEEMVMMAACSGTFAKFFMNVSDRLRNDKEFILKILKLNPDIIKYIPEELYNDREFMMNVVSSNGISLQFASEELKNDREIVEVAINSNSDALKWASEFLKCDQDLYEKAVSKNLTYHLIGKKEMLEKIDVEILEKSFENYIEECLNLPLNLPDSLKRNRKLIIKALNATMSEISNVPYDLIDKELIMEISPTKFDLLSLPLKWRSDRDIVMKALENNGKSIIYLSDELKSEFKNNKEILLKAMKTDSIPFLYASEELQNDRNFVLESVSLNGLVLKHVPFKYQCDREIVMAAVKNDGSSIQYGSSCFTQDREIMWNAVQNSRTKKPCNPLLYASFEIRSDRELILQGVRHNYSALQYCNSDLCSDEEFMFTCAEINILCLFYANYQLRYNVEFLSRLNKAEILKQVDLHEMIDIEGLIGYYPKLKQVE